MFIFMGGEAVGLNMKGAVEEGHFFSNNSAMLNSF
jgi:hypothetical protein